MSKFQKLKCRLGRHTTQINELGQFTWKRCVMCGKNLGMKIGYVNDKVDKTEIIPDKITFDPYKGPY